MSQSTAAVISTALESQSEEIWYRFEDVMYSPGCDEFGDPLRCEGELKVELRKFKVIKHTPKGVWIDHIWNHGEYKRFVLASATKKFACSTLDDAKVSFIARKKRQIQIHSAAVRRAERAIAMMCPFTTALGKGARKGEGASQGGSPRNCG